MRHVSEGAVQTGSQAPGLGRDSQPHKQRVGKGKEKTVTTKAQMPDLLGRYGTEANRALRVRCFCERYRTFEGADSLPDPGSWF
jgi:hypothetical protein